MKLKNLLSAFVFSFLCVTTGFSQTKFAIANSSDQFATANKVGIYSFSIPESITKKDVELSAEFYTMYFKVSFNEDIHTIEIKLIETEEKNKHVICRMLISLGLREVNYMGKNYPVEEFYRTFLYTGK